MKDVTVLRPCAVCGKQCQIWQKNTDGTYAHDNCLRNVQMHPDVKSR